MKKSSLIVLLGILAAVITLASADLKLKSSYDKKEIHTFMIYTELPSFHYIKDDFSSKQTYEWYICNIISADKCGVGSGYNISGDLLNFVVKNDTLFIRKKDGMGLNDIAYGLPITVYCNTLKGVFARSCDMNISGKIADTISATAVNKADINFRSATTTYIDATADNNAKIAVSAMDTLQNLSLHLRSHGSFIMNNVAVLHKELLMGDSATLQLTGRSLDNFGIRKQRIN